MIRSISAASFLLLHPDPESMKWCIVERHVAGSPRKGHRGLLPHLFDRVRNMNVPCAKYTSGFKVVKMLNREVINS